MRDHRHTSGHVRALAIATAVAGAVSVALTAVASAQVVPRSASFTGLPMGAIEGDSRDFHVAAVSGETLSDITVDWGDSSAKSTGAVDGGQVHATHTYAEAGTYTVTVTADATLIPAGPQGPQGVALDSMPVKTTATATITDATVNLQAEKTRVVEGGGFDGRVAHGKDHNSSGSLDDFSAVIDWGDGSAPQPCSSCIVATPAGFDVNAKHQYSTAGVYDVATMVRDGGTDVRRHPVRTRVIVPIVAGAVSGAEGVQFSGTVGSVIPPKHFDDVVTPDIAVLALDAVSIDWGDGSGSSAGTIGSDGTVTASHTYSEEGVYTITLTGGDGLVKPLSKGHTVYTATNSMTIGDAPLTGAPGATPFTATAGTVLAGVFGNVVDTYGAAPLGDLSATIDWGDGSSSAATLSAAGTSSAVAKLVATSGYNASGSHTYTTAGPKNGVVHFVDKGGATVNVPFVVNVTASQVQGITSSPNPSGNGPTSISGGHAGLVSTPNTGAELSIGTAALLVVSGGSLFAVGRRRRS